MKTKEDKIEEKDLRFNIPMLEYTFTHLIGRWGMACEKAKTTGDINKIWAACSNLWYGINGLNKVTIACRGLVHNNAINDDSHCINLSYAIMNEMQTTGKYIKSLIGKNPITDKNIFGF